MLEARHLLPPPLPPPTAQRFGGRAKHTAGPCHEAVHAFMLESVPEVQLLTCLISLLTCLKQVHNKHLRLQQMMPVAVLTRERTICHAVRGMLGCLQCDRQQVQGRGHDEVCHMLCGSQGCLQHLAWRWQLRHGR